jgi:hypothetical protein
MALLIAHITDNQIQQAPRKHPRSSPRLYQTAQDAVGGQSITLRWGGSSSFVVTVQASERKSILEIITQVMEIKEDTLS